MKLTACVFALFLMAGCSRPEGPSVWFVHATDPHVFVPASQDADKDKKSTGEKQEELNEKALADTLKRIRSLPEGDGPPAFLVLTGDFGTDPCDISKPVATPPAKGAVKPGAKGTKSSASTAPAQDCPGDESKRKDQVERLARTLGASPVHPIYLVAGNNDVAHERPGDAELGYFNKFIDDVQAKIRADKNGVQLHNLTSCYVSGGGPCVADVTAGTTSYRLIGLPSFSFKNEDANAQSSTTEEAQFEKFRGLVDQARQDGKRVLILSHIPPLDDPYLMAQGRYTGKGPSTTSAWNVSKKILDGWKEVVASEGVVGVLAGHLHDSHKEIYQSPYEWSTNEQRGAIVKLFLAPPLAVKKQDVSPIQARGFALMQLRPDGLKSRLYWYKPESGDFTEQQNAEFEQGQNKWWRLPGRLLNLDQNDSPLVRIAVLLIAFFTAFLTVVAIWQIPPAKETDAKKTDGQSDATAKPGPFGTKIGQTALAGLGGLMVTEVAKSLGTDKPLPDTKWYYIVWFILFFFGLLIVLNLLRACIEALRARVVMVYWPRYRLWGPIDWLISWRIPFLTFCDTFFNLIQGKNQTETYALHKNLVDQHWNLIRAADSIRKDLNELVERKVDKPAGTARKPLEELLEEVVEEALEIPTQRAPTPGAKTGGTRVRVNISVLSQDRSSVYYISQSHGSLHAAFKKTSVAWVSVFTGEIRWYLSAFRDHAKRIVLFDNRTGDVPGEDKKLWLLSDFFQARQKEDYQAFVMFPFPWPRRGYGGDYVKGAIHISFRDDADFLHILSPGDFTRDSEQHLYYPSPGSSLDEFCPDAEVRATLNTSIRILAELLQGFNEEIYKTYIEPRQQGLDADRL